MLNFNFNESNKSLDYSNFKSLPIYKGLKELITLSKSTFLLSSKLILETFGKLALLLELLMMVLFKRAKLDLEHRVKYIKQFLDNLAILEVCIEAITDEDKLCQQNIVRFVKLITSLGNQAGGWLKNALG